MSVAPRYIPHYTIEDYQSWEGDWELIDGVPISMTPSPFGPHERIVSRLSYQIQGQIQRNQCACEIYTNLDWIISDDTVIRPDLMVVCGEQPPRHLERPPALMVEVLSESTRSRDLTAKRTLVRENAVPHYLVIDPSERTVLQIVDGGQQTFDIAQLVSLSLEDDCQINIDCSKLFD